MSNSKPTKPWERQRDEGGELESMLMHYRYTSVNNGNR